jgi:hypothetical protein
VSCPHKTPGCDGKTITYKICACRTPLIYAEETGSGVVISFGAKWGLYTKEGILLREMSQQEARAVVDKELMWRSLPGGEDR